MLDDKKETQRDAGYIRMAVSNGNLSGLIERSLNCFRRENYSDYLLSHHGRGFSCYSVETDTDVLDEKTLLRTRLEEPTEKRAKLRYGTGW